MPKYWLLFALAVSAQAASLKELVAEALRNNPDIVAAQKRYEAARQRPTQESALPDPMFSLGYNSSGNPLPFQGIGVEPIANAGFMFTQEFPWPGKRKLKGQMAEREAEAEFQQYQTVQLGVQARLKAAWYRLAYAYAASDVLTRNRDLLMKLRASPKCVTRSARRRSRTCSRRRHRWRFWKRNW